MDTGIVARRTDTGLDDELVVFIRNGIWSNRYVGEPLLVLRHGASFLADFPSIIEENRILCPVYTNLSERDAAGRHRDDTEGGKAPNTNRP